jgi:transposase-like protein
MYPMEEKFNYQKRTQKDYSMSLKLQIVREIESGQISPADARRKYAIQGRATVTVWLRKYGNFDWEYQTTSHMPKTPEQRIMELEAKVKLLEKQKARLEHNAEVSDQKAVIFDMMINLAEKEYKIDIRKNSSPEQSNFIDKQTKKP